MTLGIAVAGYTRLRSLTATIARLEGRIQALEVRPREGAETPAPPLPAVAAVAPPPPAAAVSVPVPPPPAPEPIPSPPPVLTTPSPAGPFAGVGERLRALSAQREAGAAKPAASLEERLGARLPVWIGSIALALAGAFLVKYSFDQGFLSPVVRVALGVAFGVALLAGGEWMRRSSPGISQGLSAAGIADLFACFLAGVHLYQLISPAVGFAFMALTALVAVLLSLRHGPMVALIGLAGGFLTPALIRAGEPDVRNLFAYLLVLVIAVAVVSGQRGWRWVTGLALAGGIVWVLVWLAGPFQTDDAPWLSLFLVALSVAAVVSDLRRRALAPDGAGGVPGGTWLSWGALVASLGVIAIVTGASGYSTLEWAFLGLLAGSILILARLHTSFEGLGWVAAAAPALLLAAWGYDLPDVGSSGAGRFLRTVLAFGALFAIGGYLAHRGAPRPGRWASLSAASAVVYFLLAWATTVQDVDLPWGGLALGLAALYIVALLPVARQRRDHPHLDAPLAALAVAVTVFVSLAVPLELERQWLTVAWALEVAALTWLAGRFRLPALTLLARLLALAVLVRLLLNPEVFNYPIGEHPVFNWIVYGYGLPLLAFIAAAVLARRQGRTQPATELEWGALAITLVFSTLWVRQLFHPGEPGRVETGFVELGTLAALWIALGLLILVLSRRVPQLLPSGGEGRPAQATGSVGGGEGGSAHEGAEQGAPPLLASLESGGRAFLLLGCLTALFGAGFLQNPLWTHEPAGSLPIFNLLLWAFGAPAALLALGARELSRRASRLPAVLTIAALALTFLLVSLEVRQAFQGTYLDTGVTSAAERYTYSAAWIAFGIALLVIGTARKGKALRYASLAVMLLTVGKVFLYDTANL
ncbi:MAG TPA: DUF2339 domain-containing protein, partial [Thermoanaerobaculia bacterium]|nr:DUF2339 domain-containing protein [Thermoanaerobaculia bacterium]